MDDRFYNAVGGDRINSRQIDELIGISRGITADGHVNQAEAEFLEKWLAANIDISNHPIINTLYKRVGEKLLDGTLDADESLDLLDTLNKFSNRDFELGEVLKASTLPLCDPQPALEFVGRRYCFTGTFNFGQRKHCENEITIRGGSAGSLTQTTDFLVIGTYVTDSWKHSTFGSKIIKACEWRDAGIPISIVAEEHWVGYLQ